MDFSAVVVDPARGGSAAVATMEEAAAFKTKARRENMRKSVCRGVLDKR
jgi:hypothetical protein